jgi:hypothetical protein
MQPITHYDTGNRPINYLLNKIVFPLFNLGGFQWYYNYNMIPLLGLSDLLEQAKSSDPLLAQWASDTFPLEGAMGVTMEIGPALDWASAWAYTALRESAISPNSPFWLIMGGIGGGSSLKLGTLAEVIEVGGQTGTAAIEGSAQEISAARALIERITHQPATDAMIRDFLMFRNAYNEERASMELNGISFEGFDEYIVPGGDVNIGMLRGSRAADFAAANELAGIDSLPPEYVWHHHPDFGRLVAIDRDIHELLRHWGGVSIWKHLFGVDYP